MKLSVFTTSTRPTKRGDMIKQAMTCYKDLADEVINVSGDWGAYSSSNGIVSSHWPQEFDWSLIGQQFQKGYEACTGDWVIHADLDFIFHEDSFEAIRRACIDAGDAPALTFYKYQFILPDRYNLKSRLVVAVNKGQYGRRIRFDSGGDLCQPSLDGQYIKPEDVPESGVAFYNYEKLLKVEAQIKDDVGRMARAWHSHFGEYHLGGPDDDSAYQEWLHMVQGRFSKPQTPLDFDAHPKYVQDTIKNLNPEQWGYNGFGQLGVYKCYE